jgi:hypothetical protein
VASEASTPPADDNAVIVTIAPSSVVGWAAIMISTTRIHRNIGIAMEKHF